MNATSQHPTINQPVICLMGPTACGKSSAALPLTSHFNAEIISVDSALIYRGMDIGTAKPDAAILQQYPHHLIDILDPEQRYSAADFIDDCCQRIRDIHARGKIPLLVGGTMMYFHALQQGLASLPNSDPEIRQQLQTQATTQGLAIMHKQLAEIDPESAARIHENDPQRLLRALEVYYVTGKSLSSLQQSSANPNPTADFHFMNVAILPSDRQALHDRIAWRFDEMLAQGFLAEMEQLVQRPGLTADHPSMRSVGYRQAWQYLAGQFDHDTFRDKAIVATRQLAKRQYTWLRDWPCCTYFDLLGRECVRAIYEHLSRCLQPFG